jgi:hypothetical protein
VPPLPRYIDASEPSGLTFSICALVADQAKYDRLLASFARQGFTPDNSEFLAADNRHGNQFDGYSWQKALLVQAKGRFVVFCHDDVELISDGFNELLARIEEIERTDPSWLLLGIAGGIWHVGKRGRDSLALRISDSVGDNRHVTELPSRVESLDECFILMRRTRPVLPSVRLTGFHFYGTDMCLQAELAGGTAYVVDFHLRHYGAGTIDSAYHQCKANLIAAYLPYFPGRRLRCTTGMVKFRGGGD